MSSDDYSNKVVRWGNGYAICGSTSKQGAGGYDAHLQYYDNAGVLQWEKQYGGSGTEYGTALAVTDSGYVIVGRSNSFSGNNSQDISLTKTDLNGNMQWTKVYRSDSTEYGLGVSSNGSGGYYITGQTKASGNGGYDMFVIKTDSAGNVLWSKTYGGTGDDIGVFVSQADNGNLLAAGNSVGGAGMQDAYLTYINGADGSLLAQLMLGGSGYDEARQIVFSNDGFYILGTTGSQGQDKCYIAKVNGNTLSLEWAKTYGGTNVDQLSGAYATADAHLVVSGYTNSFGNSNGSDGLIFEVDTLGNVMWADVAGGSSGQTYFQDVYADGNRPVITGFTDGFGHDANNSVFLAEPIDSLGTFCNNFTPVNLTVTTWSATLAGPVIADHSANNLSLTVSSAAFTQNTYTPATVNVCTSVPLAVSAGTPATICQGNSTTIGGSPTASGGAVPYTYSWSPSAGLSSATVANPVASPTVTTSYTVTVTDGNSNSSTASVNITVDVVPAITFTVDSPACVEQGTITLTATPSGGTFQGSNVSGNVLNVAAAGAGDVSITYTYTDGASCSASAIAIAHVEVCTGISELTSNGISITPNPSNGNFEVTLGNNVQANEYKVFDLAGKQVDGGYITNANGKFRISSSAENTGTYVLQINTADGNHLYRQLMIEK